MPRVSWAPIHGSPSFLRASLRLPSRCRSPRAVLLPIVTSCSGNGRGSPPGLITLIIRNAGNLSPPGLRKFVEEFERPHRVAASPALIPEIVTDRAQGKFLNLAYLPPLPSVLAARPAPPRDRARRPRCTSPRPTPRCARRRFAPPRPLRTQRVARATRPPRAPLPIACEQDV